MQPTRYMICRVRSLTTVRLGSRLHRLDHFQPLRQGHRARLPEPWSRVGGSSPLGICRGYTNCRPPAILSCSTSMGINSPVGSANAVAEASPSGTDHGSRKGSSSRGRSDYYSVSLGSAYSNLFRCSPRGSVTTRDASAPSASLTKASARVAAASSCRAAASWTDARAARCALSASLVIVWRSICWANLASGVRVYLSTSFLARSASIPPRGRATLPTSMRVRRVSRHADGGDAVDEEPFQIPLGSNASRSRSASPEGACGSLRARRVPREGGREQDNLISLEILDVSGRVTEARRVEFQMAE
jgi:hypothetical protein